MANRAMATSVLFALVVLAFVDAGSSLVRSGEAGPAPTRHVVQIVQLRFRPAELTVAAGDTVVWINRDIVPHTVSGEEEGWSSGELTRDSVWQWVARGDGSMPYYCEYHPTMRGRVIVVD